MQTLLEQIDQGQQWTFPGGIHPPERKTLSNGTPIAGLPMPERFWVPVRQHIGQSGRLLVASGDTVLKGQALTRADHPMAVPVHAPTSGTVGRIEPRAIAHPSGLSELCIEILPDGEDHWRPRESRVNVEGLERDAILARIRDAGIAGLGGATFPAAIKLSTNKPVQYLIINGAECEPYITSDDRLMQDHAEAILAGIDILDHLLQPERILFAIEDNKPAAIAAVRTALASSHRDPKRYLLRVIPTKYPSGSEKQLIQIVTGLEIPKGQLPADLGVLMQNVGTCYAIKRAVLDDEPLIERVVTVTGEQAGKPGNYWVRLGTDIQWLLEQTQSKPQPGQPLIMGGPMMGFALPATDVPVVKATNCLLLPSTQELPPSPAARNCIRCGECAQVCPQSLLPQQLYWHSQAAEYDKAAQLNLSDCIECGACAFVCPSDIPLVHHYRIAKAELRETTQKAQKAEEAKLRFDARQARLEKEKAERENRHKRAEKTAPAAPSAGVEAALARIKAKQAATEGETDMAELRRQRKEQARAAKAAREDAGTASGDDRQAAVAAAVARAKAKQGAQENDSAEVPSAEDKRKAAVAAAVARAKARQAGEASDAAADAPADDKRKAAVAAAIAKAKAKQAAGSDDSAADAPAEDKRKAAVAAAIAKAKAKQAAEAGDAAAEAPAEDKRKTAVAAAIAKAKAKQAAESDDSASEAPAEDKRKAAVAAAIAKAKAKQAVEAGDSTTEAPAEDKRKAAVAAAIAKAKAKQAAEAGDSAAEAPAEDKRKAAVAAAIAKAKAKQAAEKAEQQADSEASASDSAKPKATESDPRKAAIARAIAKAKAKQQQNSDQ
ncbi:electron transport complex subunit RsxC [Ferrimonas balearica]|uniref:electron transport complex subunit RsxC n=1 Tax=Ferrimonas balearica TaxID=44012 RepID=UPI001C98F6DC|nr:electron transport complex subunit RsxC [Ferrimonas balearica]MBY5920084.1 electron transport complex subunit RsxC [Ferrimonas balearica]MBY5997231.1 electron transport complex subunit RsxC [Ferrimonas balearica]